jgi:hypothetical protein
MQPFSEATSPSAIPTGSHLSLRTHRVSLGFGLLLTLWSLSSVSAQSIVLFGNQIVVTGRDYNSPGAAEAFQMTATSVGTLNSLTIYLDGSTAATTMYAGLYADSSGSPGTMLTKGSIGLPTAGAWNVVNVTPASIVSGGMRAFTRLYGLQTVVLRYFTVFGPYQVSDVSLFGLQAVLPARADRRAANDLWRWGAEPRFYLYRQHGARQSTGRIRLA